MLFAAGLCATISASDSPDAARAAAIQRLNALPNMTWTAGRNEKWQGHPRGSSRSLAGSKGLTQERQERLRARVAEGSMRFVSAIPGASRFLPAQFDAAKHWPHCAQVIDDIRDQSNCGCCWAFGAAESASDRLCVATNASVAIPLSAEELCFCASEDGCDGGEPEEAWQRIKKHGLATGGQVNSTGPFGGLGLCSSFTLPHCHHHGPVGHGGDPFPAEGAPGCPEPKTSPACPTACDAQARPPFDDFSSYRFRFDGYVQTYDNDADTIALAILRGGPVTASFDVYDDFEDYVGGIYVVKSKVALGGHAVRIVGWGTDAGVPYWKVANSWNRFWGEQGYFRIRRGTDEAGIEASTMSSAVDLTAWRGPGVPPPAPPPSPGPHPPSPSPPLPPAGDCTDQMSRRNCSHTSSEQRVCKWCEIGKDVGYCTRWTEGCL